jgi:lactoylglutathione lyase
MDVKGILKHAWGYKGDAMNLPVGDVDTATPYYEEVMRFTVSARTDGPPRSVTLERDKVRMRLAENGGDPTQDGCAFEVENVEALFSEFKANGWYPPIKDDGDFDIETRETGSWKVFFVVAPDGLCYWFGERFTEETINP